MQLTHRARNTRALPCTTSSSGNLFRTAIPIGALPFTSEREGISLTDHDNFVHQQNGNDRQRDPRGKYVSSKEIEDHSRPAGANRNQSPADVERSHCSREVRALDVPEPKELAQSPNDNNKLNRDSYLRPTFFDHAEDCSWEEALTRKGLLCLLKSPSRRANKRRKLALWPVLNN